MEENSEKKRIEKTKKDKYICSGPEKCSQVKRERRSRADRGERNRSRRYGMEAATALLRKKKNLGRTFL